MTVSYRNVPGFHELPIQEATGLIYQELVPVCEAKGVLLSSYGNNSGLGSLKNVASYQQDKAARLLFDVPRVQKVFASIDNIAQPASTFRTGSYGLKHRVEERQGEYLTNGDLIVCMLLKGYQAKFGKRGEQLEVNCMFKAKLLD